jgi:hypothetical protein
MVAHGPGIELMNHSQQNIVDIISQDYMMGDMYIGASDVCKNDRQLGVHSLQQSHHIHRLQLTGLYGSPF